MKVKFLWIGVFVLFMTCLLATSGDAELYQINLIPIYRCG